MGNCQAAEAAAVVIQHPSGKVERLYGAATTAEVMRGNPGHYVALVVLRVSGAGGGKQDAAAFVDYSSVLDVSENLGYGESSSNSSNWNCGAEMSNAVLDSEVLHWAPGGAAAKPEPYTELEQQQHSGGYGGGGQAVDDDDDALEHKFLLPCGQEQSLAHFDFNLEYF